MHEKWRISNQRIFPSKDERTTTREKPTEEMLETEEETNEEDQSNLITIFEISNKYSAL